jgi:hypothetical protein
MSEDREIPGWRIWKGATRYTEGNAQCVDGRFYVPLSNDMNSLQATVDAFESEIARLRAVITETCAKIRPPLGAIKDGGMHECSSEYIEKIINRAENALEEK